jgi:glycosyltransferase involved in cell wall biosynthesis
MTKQIPKISVITPAFNAEKYLQEMINSVQSQTFTNYEHIVIDDGSTDNTNLLLKDYAAKDNRVVYLQADHEGPSVARNHGLKIARGNYITFIDADDTVRKETLARLFDKARKTKADVIFYNFIYFYDDNKSRCVFNPVTADPDVVYTKDNLSSKLFNTFSIITCNKLVKTNIIRKNKLSFNSKYLRDEDVDFSIRTMLAAKTFAYEDFYGYFYRLENPHSETATNNKYPTELLKILLDLNNRKEFKDPRIKQSFDNYAINQIVGCLDRQESSSNTHRLVFDFIQKEVIPKLELKKINENYTYNHEMFEYFDVIRSANYSTTILYRVGLLKERIKTLDIEFRDAQECLNNNTKRLRAVQKELEKLRESTSWKITKPLRLVGKIKQSHKKRK